MNNTLVVAAAVLFGFSRRAGSFEMIMLGRLLIGISAGMGAGCLSFPTYSLIPFMPFIHVFSLFTDLLFIHAHLFFFFLAKLLNVFYLKRLI